MSEPELAYMTNSNDDFDLPRWQTQAQIEPLSSSAQAAQAAARASYLYPGAAPPPPPPPPSGATNSQRLHALHHSPGSSRQVRMTHLLDQDNPPSVSTTSYLSGALNQLSRSASLGASASIANTARARRHHQPDDLEGAFNVDNQIPSSRSMVVPQTPSAYSLYPTSTGLHQSLPVHSSSTPSNNTSPATTAEPYSEMYYNGSSGTGPKRTQTQLDPTSRSGRSPMRTGNTLLDPYQQQAQYSPTSTSAFLYGSSSSDIHRGSSSSTGYSSHSRSHSHVKQESTPPISTPFSPQTAAQAAHAGYAMEPSSPQPASHQNQSHLSANQVPIKSSTSTPNTPLSFAHPQSPANQFYSQDQAMAIDAPQHRRRASGFRRVRDSRDLRPYVNNQPLGRRVDSNGVVLSVCSPCFSRCRARQLINPESSPYGNSPRTLLKHTIFAIPSFDMNQRTIHGESLRSRASLYTMTATTMRIMTISSMSMTGWEVTMATSKSRSPPRSKTKHDDKFTTVVTSFWTFLVRERLVRW